MSSRRKFLQSAGVLLMGCSLKTKSGTTDSQNNKGFRVLNENDHVDIGDKAQLMVKKAYDLGYRFEEKHKGCARCTVAALQDAIDFIPADDGLFRAASCLDGGATPTNLASCGAFTGSGMVLGWICGTQRFGDNSLSRKLIHQVHRSFVDKYGSVICKNIRSNSGGTCPEVVANGAKWTTEIILKQFMNEV
jgi:C_GCAxxG_C_C family probable redox protein